MAFTYTKPLYGDVLKDIQPVSGKGSLIAKIPGQFNKAPYSLPFSQELLSNEIINAYGIGSTYFTRQDFYQDNADIINALRLAQAEAIGLIAADLEGVAETLSSIFELEPQHIVDAMKMCPPTPVYSGYDKLATLLYDIGLIDNTPTKFEDLFNYEDLDHE